MGAAKGGGEISQQVLSSCLHADLLSRANFLSEPYWALPTTLLNVCHPEELPKLAQAIQKSPKVTVLFLNNEPLTHYNLGRMSGNN
ncbi:hypothetical protein [Brasilonema sp. UFV-L1]|uniref:hypothetical protein n=1 Tax=Brasilonema sp. UFV-L1 TaxID=2234130 RepID=UPI00145E57D4|nr:hypothetical protein [Brasilonema sp. UFV-L1]